MPKTYLIVDSGQADIGGEDYVDYLLNIEYAKDNNPNLIEIPHDETNSEWDEVRVNYPRQGYRGISGGKTERRGTLALFVCAFLLFGVPVIVWLLSEAK